MLAIMDLQFGSVFCFHGGQDVVEMMILCPDGRKKISLTMLLSDKNYQINISFVALKTQIVCSDNYLCQ